MRQEREGEMEKQCLLQSKIKGIMPTALSLDLFHLLLPKLVFLLKNQSLTALLKMQMQSCNYWSSFICLLIFFQFGLLCQVLIDIFLFFEHVFRLNEKKICYHHKRPTKRPHVDIISLICKYRRTVYIHHTKCLISRKICHWSG